jgi:hypothetical protein
VSAGPALGRLLRAFPKQPLTQDTFAEYGRDLADVDEGLLDAAATFLIRTSREPWFPTVGEIRAACAEIALALPTEAEAVAQVDARIAWARMGGSERAPAVHPLVTEALGMVGGYPALKTAEDPARARAAFARVYRTLRWIPRALGRLSLGCTGRCGSRRCGGPFSSPASTVPRSNADGRHRLEVPEVRLLDPAAGAMASRRSQGRDRFPQGRPRPRSRRRLR